MKELSSHLQLLLVEARELEGKMNEFKDGLKEQVSSILTTPLPNPPPATDSVTNLIDLGTTIWSVITITVSVRMFKFVRLFRFQFFLQNRDHMFH